ncbi:PTS sugar transporter subunit IIB [Enterococcus faecalis]|uniref:PTS sugar transporter subunit IIB n=1 Tax=Enterococcus faecalis TaxID=1351 RepID=UPI00115A5200|nr:PTS sugar transporter subunit IIB [Enterococcus faecalis]MBD9865714.1 PTS sugar transporter subunit IIB [Enterococcus faecalis]MBD9867128.1 PTS sugar transporter subunit IIB [Enterococcus faecalis]
METKPNVKMVRIDERLIHGQGQLWIKSLGVNLVICADDKAATDSTQQTLMKTVVPSEVGIRFWNIERTAKVIWKASPEQSIFMVVSSPKDVLALAEQGFPVGEVNVGNIHAKEGKEKVSQFIYLGEEDKAALRTLRDKYGCTFNTKTSPVSNDGAQSLDALNKLLG